MSTLTKGYWVATAFHIALVLMTLAACLAIAHVDWGPPLLTMSIEE